MLGRQLSSAIGRIVKAIGIGWRAFTSDGRIENKPRAELCLFNFEALAAIFGAYKGRLVHR